MPRTNRAYWRLISFLKGERDVSSDREFAIAAVVSRRSFLSKDQAVELVGRMLTPERFAEVAARDIAFARDLFRAVDRQFTVPAAIAEDLGLADWSKIGRASCRESVCQDV